MSNQLNYEQIRQKTSKEFVTELKKEVKSITSGAAPSKIQSLFIDEGESYYDIAIKFDVLIVLGKFSRSEIILEYFRIDTLTTRDYYLLKQIMEGDRE